MLFERVEYVNLAFFGGGAVEAGALVVVAGGPVVSATESSVLKTAKKVCKVLFLVKLQTSFKT